MWKRGPTTLSKGGTSSTDGSHGGNADHEETRTNNAIEDWHNKLNGWIPRRKRGPTMLSKIGTTSSTGGSHRGNADQQCHRRVAQQAQWTDPTEETQTNNAIEDWHNKLNGWIPWRKRGPTMLSKIGTTSSTDGSHRGNADQQRYRRVAQQAQRTDPTEETQTNNAIEGWHNKLNGWIPQRKRGPTMLSKIGTTSSTDGSHGGNADQQRYRRVAQQAQRMDPTEETRTNNAIEDWHNKLRWVVFRGMAVPLLQPRGHWSGAFSADQDARHWRHPLAPGTAEPKATIEAAYTAEASQARATAMSDNILLRWCNVNIWVIINHDDGVSQVRRDQSCLERQQSIKRSFDFIDENIMTLLYATLVRPIIEYSNVIWAPPVQKHINTLESVQRRATRMVLNLKDLTIMKD